MPLGKDHDSDFASWPLVFALIVLVPEIIHVIATLLQRSRVGSPLPPELQGIYDQRESETSSKYAKARIDFSLTKHVFDLAVFYAFWFLAGFPFVDEFVVGLGFKSQVANGLFFMGCIGIASALLSLPWDVYSTFVLEERFGFNKTTPLTFIKDMCKVIVLAVLIGVPVVALILWIFDSLGDTAWFWAFAAVTVVMFVFFFLWPVVILPIFFSLIPLPEGNALITSKTTTDFPEFLSGRLFYSSGTHNEKTVWTTADQRFSGSSAGSTLSVCWLTSGFESPCWAIVEGTPNSASKTYATHTAPSITDAGSLIDGPLWSLTPDGRAAVENRGDHAGGNGNAEQNAAFDAPLVQELRTTCVEVGKLRAKLVSLAQRLGYHGANIYVIDGSSRSEHSNAFCTGFGRFRRICLFDTLLALMDVDEIVAVLGHEIGHDRLYHVHTGLIVQCVLQFIQYYAMGQFMTSQVVSDAFFVKEPKLYIGITLFTIVWSVVNFVIEVPVMMMTRSNEYAADRYAVDADRSYSELLVCALIKLSKKSKSNMTPHPFYAFLNYSHPPLGTRILAIRQHSAVKYG